MTDLPLYPNRQNTRLSIKDIQVLRRLAMTNSGEPRHLRQVKKGCWRVFGGDIQFSQYKLTLGDGAAAHLFETGLIDQDGIITEKGHVYLRRFFLHPDDPESEARQGLVTRALAGISVSEIARIGAMIAKMEGSYWEGFEPEVMLYSEPQLDRSKYCERIIQEYLIRIIAPEREQVRLSQQDPYARPLPEAVAPDDAPKPNSWLAQLLGSFRRIRSSASSDIVVSRNA